jgi:hypothetical protein
MFDNDRRNYNSFNFENNLKGPKSMSEANEESNHSEILKDRYSGAEYNDVGYKSHGNNFYQPKNEETPLKAKTSVNWMESKNDFPSRRKRPSTMNINQGSTTNVTSIINESSNQENLIGKNRFDSKRGTFGMSQTTDLKKIDVIIF